MSSLISTSEERIIFADDDAETSKSVLDTNLINENYDADEINADEKMGYDLISSLQKKNIISALRSNNRRSKEDLTNFSPVVSVGEILEKVHPY